MTQADTDQLERWLVALTNEQLRLLWRWVTLYTMARLGRHMRRGEALTGGRG